MDRNYKMALISMLTWVPLVSCTPQVTFTDMVGVWSNPNGAELIIKSDGVFQASHLPGGNVFWNSENFHNYEGYGHWKLATKNNSPELVLHFDTYLPGQKRIAGMNPGFETQLMINVSRNDLYLFGWIENEGGERFKFTRKPL